MPWIILVAVLPFAIQTVTDLAGAQEKISVNLSVPQIVGHRVAMRITQSIAVLRCALEDVILRTMAHCFVMRALMVIFLETLEHVFYHITNLARMGSIRQGLKMNLFALLLITNILLQRTPFIATKSVVEILMMYLQ